MDNQNTEETSVTCGFLFVAHQADDEEFKHFSERGERARLLTVRIVFLKICKIWHGKGMEMEAFDLCTLGHRA